MAEQLIKKLVRFVSPSERAAKQLPPTMKNQPNQIKALLSKFGSKQVELDYAGLDEWLASQPDTVAAEDIVRFLEEKGPMREIGRLELEGNAREPQAAHEQLSRGMQAFDDTAVYYPEESDVERLKGYPLDDGSLAEAQTALDARKKELSDLKEAYPPRSEYVTRPSHEQFARSLDSEWPGPWLPGESGGDLSGTSEYVLPRDFSEGLPPIEDRQVRKFADPTRTYQPETATGPTMYGAFTEPGNTGAVRNVDNDSGLNMLIEDGLVSGPRPENYREVLFYDPQNPGKFTGRNQAPLDPGIPYGLSPSAHESDYFVRYFNDPDAINVQTVQSDIGQKHNRARKTIQPDSAEGLANQERYEANNKELARIVNSGDYQGANQRLNALIDEQNPEIAEKIRSGNLSALYDRQRLAVKERGNARNYLLASYENLNDVPEPFFDAAINGTPFPENFTNDLGNAGVNEDALRALLLDWRVTTLSSDNRPTRFIDDYQDYQLSDILDDGPRGSNPEEGMGLYARTPEDRIKALREYSKADSPIVLQNKWKSMIARQILAEAAQTGKPIVLPTPQNVLATEGMPPNAAQVFYKDLANEIKKAAKQYGGVEIASRDPNTVVFKDNHNYRNIRSREWYDDENDVGYLSKRELYAENPLRANSSGDFEAVKPQIDLPHPQDVETPIPEQVGKMGLQRAGTVITLPPQTINAIRERGMDFLSLAAMAGAGAFAGGGTAEAGEPEEEERSGLLNMTQGEKEQFLESLSPEDRAWTESAIESSARVADPGVGLEQYLTQYEADETQLADYQHQYAVAVNDSLDRPVISVQAAIDQTGLSDIADRYEGGYLTVRELLREFEGVKSQQRLQAAMLERLDGRKMSGEQQAAWQRMVNSFSEAARSRPSAMETRIGGVLAGTLKNDPSASQLATGISRLVSEHSTGGKYALDPSRTQSQQDAVDAERGDYGKYTTSEPGLQNHEAQRVAELWSAQSANYLPAGAMAQVQRAIGGLTAPIYNAAMGYNSNRNGSAWDEMGRMATPDGKFGYAAEVYNRSSGDLEKGGDQPIYTPEGEAKYGSYDPQNNPIGLANAYSENTSFPLASWYQYLKQFSPTSGSGLGQTLGAAAGDDRDAMSKLNKLRQNYNRVSPVIPDGVDSKAYSELGERLKESDEKLAGWNSAKLGPQFADAYNATPLATLGKMRRSYLSPAAQTAVEAVGESVTDPVNLIANTAMPFAGAALGGISGLVKGGVKAGAKAAGNSLIRNLAKAPLNVIGDIGEEQVEGGVILGPALTGWKDWFAPEKNNLLMGDMDPNDPNYDEEFERRSLDARQEQYDVASDLSDLTGEKKTKPKQRKPLAYTGGKIL